MTPQVCTRAAAQLFVPLAAQRHTWGVPFQSLSNLNKLLMVNDIQKNITKQNSPVDFFHLLLLADHQRLALF